MIIQVHVINAFSIDGRGGNPAGVVFDADHLSGNTKQAIATSAGFPETAFVSSSKVADYKLEFFTPLKQIPHCGHATIATFSYLKSNSKIASNQSSKETIDGCRSIVFEDGLAFMEQKAPTYRIVPDLEEEIFHSLGISQNDMRTGLVPTVVNTGNSFLIVPVKDEKVLAGINSREDEVYRICEEQGFVGYYIYAKPTASEFDATTRMFAPFYGISEEPATGMAAGTLAAYLFKEEKLEKKVIMIEQGRFMHPVSPSRIQVNLDFGNGEITRIFAGGSAYVSDTKVIELPD
jgi:PhzF family phenazine biosynthesis protein